MTSNIKGYFYVLLSHQVVQAEDRSTLNCTLHCLLDSLFIPMFCVRWHLGLQWQAIFGNNCLAQFV